MEIKLLKVLVNNISSFFYLSAHESIKCQPIQKYYQRIEEILKLIKSVLDAIIDGEIASDEKIQKAFVGLGHAIEELREFFDNWQPLMSKVYFVLQVESLIVKVRSFGLEIFELLKSSEECIPSELSVAALEKLKNIGTEQISATITEAVKDQVEASGASSESMVKIADSLNLKSNQELLIEAVALEKLKENAEQAETNGEVAYIDQMIALVTCMHDDLILMKQSQSSSAVPIPADFCCPLSLELMTDPVIVASGQTYERAFIRKWIELGLTVCPKTRQTLAHTNLIPNYTVKALIASWCELNNVKLPDPLKSNSLNQSGLLLAHAEPGAPRDSYAQSHSRVNHSTSPESTRSLGSPMRSLIPSSVIQQEGSYPSHLRSSSEDSLGGVAGNGHGLDIENASLGNVEDRLVNSVDRSGQLYASPSRDNTARAYEQSSRGHNRTASASSTRSNSIPGDGNDTTSQSVAYSPDISGEATLEAQPASTVRTPQREPEYPSRIETRPRNQTIWRRPSQNFAPRIVSSPAVETRADLSDLEAQVRVLVEELKNSSLDVQRNATSELRLLAKHNMDNRIVIANCGAIRLLVHLLYSTDTKIQENAVTALLNLSINDNNKTAIANADAIEPLIHVLETGSPEAKENSAATLFSLSVIEENKVKIGRSRAIQPLVDLLGNGTPRGKKDAATALFNLSIFHDNKAHIVQAGAVKYLVELMDPAAGMVDKAVAVLSILATIPEGRTAIGQEGGIPVLVDVVELGSARGKENAAAALLQLCTDSNRFCNMVLQEGAVPPLVALTQFGTPRAREKAQLLLSFFRNYRHGNAGRG